MKYFLITIMLIICSVAYSQQKTATYYHDKYQGRVTKSGEIFDQNKLTCASNEYPLGTILKVTNTENYKSVIVKVNDTGNLYGRTVDLSRKAFQLIANLERGIIKVTIQVIGFEKIKRY